MQHANHQSSSSDNPYGAYTQMNQNWENQRQAAVREENNRRMMDDMRRQQQQQEDAARASREREAQARRAQQAQQQQASRSSRATNSSGRSAASSGSSASSSSGKFTPALAVLTFLIAWAIIHDQAAIHPGASATFAAIIGLFIGRFWRGLLMTTAVIAAIAIGIHLINNAG